MWEGFHNAVTKPLQYSSIPFAPAPGNHDASAYSSFPKKEENISGRNLNTILTLSIAHITRSITVIWLMKLFSFLSMHIETIHDAAVVDRAAAKCS